MTAKVFLPGGQRPLVSLTKELPSRGKPVSRTDARASKRSRVSPSRSGPVTLPGSKPKSPGFAPFWRIYLAGNPLSEEAKGGQVDAINKVDFATMQMLTRNPNVNIVEVTGNRVRIGRRAILNDRDLLAEDLEHGFSPHVAPAWR